MPHAKIAITMPRLGLYGGAEGFGWRLAQALVQAGHTVDFLCAREEGEAPAGVNVVELGRPPLGRAIKNLWFAYAADRHLRRTAYDVVIGLSRTWGQDILRVGGGPQSVFQRLSLPAHGEGLWREKKRLLRTLCPANAVIGWLERRQFEAPQNPRQRIVCVSHLVRDWLLEAHPGIDASRVSVVYNRPDLTRFAPPSAERRAELRAQRGRREDDVVICTAGTNFALKGVGTLVHALALLPANYHLEVAGGRHGGAWEHMAEHLGVGERVRFLGRVSDMPSFYAAADVFALPTYYDACSNAVLEAQACGIPAISSARNGSAVFVPRELVLDDPSDAQTLARLILRAAESTTRPGAPFQWPDGHTCGLTPYLDMVEEILAEKRARA